MVVVGMMAATDKSVRESTPPGFVPYVFHLIPMTDTVILATLIFFALRARFDSSAHKHIIYVATTALLIAAIARWPLVLVHRNAPRAAILSCLFLLILVAHDWWSTPRIHRATLRASAFLIFKATDQAADRQNRRLACR